MIIPIGDTQVRGGHLPIVSYTFIILNVAIFLYQTTVQGNLVCEFAAVPYDVINGQNLYTLITSMFLHGSYMHLIGNMIFLWVFADNIEAIIGSWKFLLFYIGGGLLGAIAHIYFSTYNTSLADIQCMPCSILTPCGGTVENIPSAVIPMLGASGAISAVMGAYLMMFPRSKIKILVLILFRSFYIPAVIFLVIWFGQQLFSGISTIGATEVLSEDVAWWAHIGGFAFGMICGLIYRPLVYLRR